MRKLVQHAALGQREFTDEQPFLEQAELPRAGKRLLATVKRERAALRALARRRRAALSRGDRARVDAHARQLGTQPLRWG